MKFISETEGPIVAANTYFFVEHQPSEGGAAYVLNIYDHFGDCDGKGCPIPCKRFPFYMAAAKWTLNNPMPGVTRVMRASDIPGKGIMTNLALIIDNGERL